MWYTSRMRDERIESLERSDGMATERGTAWEAVLRRGWQYDGEHTLLAPTLHELRSTLKLIKPCTCEQCR